MYKLNNSAHFLIGLIIPNNNSNSVCVLCVVRFGSVIWREGRGSRLSQKMRASEEWEDKTRSGVRQQRE